MSTPAKRAVARKKPAAPMSLRDALAAKKVRTESYDIPLVDSRTAAEAAETLRAVRAEWSLVEHAAGSEGEELRDSVKVRLTAAEKTWATCFRRIEFRGLADGDFDALENEHPPTDEQREKGARWNEETFPYALIAACYLGDDGLSADEWAEELSDRDRWPRADKQAIIQAAFDANLNEFSEGIPKG